MWHTDVTCQIQPLEIACIDTAPEDLYLLPVRQLPVRQIASAPAAIAPVRWPLPARALPAARHPAIQLTRYSHRGAPSHAQATCVAATASAPVSSTTRSSSAATIAQTSREPG